MGSSGIDSGVESTSDGLRDLPSIAISLCGGLSDNREITKGTAPGMGAGFQAESALLWQLVGTSRSLGFCASFMSEVAFTCVVSDRTSDSSLLMTYMLLACTWLTSGFCCSHVASGNIRAIGAARR